MVKPAKWMDLFALLFSLVVIVGAALWTLGSGIFSTTALNADPKLAWHLTRSAGISAYLLLFASIVWGLFISGQHVKNWSPERSPDDAYRYRLAGAYSRLHPCFTVTRRHLL